MKRMIALIMILALCASLALAACSKLKKGDVEKDPAAAVADALALVSDGTAAYTVIPQENTLGGPVTDYIDALSACQLVSYAAAGRPRL